MLVMSGALLDAGDDQKIQVIELLGYFKNPGGVLPLSTVLDNVTDKNSRILAAISLGRIGDKSAVSALGRILGNADGDPEVRAAAAWALGELKSPNAVSYLTTKKLQGISDPAPLVRLFSLFALARLNDPSSVPDIILHLSSNDINNTVMERQAAALALGIMGSKQATAPLIAALEVEGAAPTKSAMLRAIGAIGDESTLPLLLREAWSQESTVSAQAMFAISHFGEPITMTPSAQISERLFSKDSPPSAITKESLTRDTLATPISKKDASALLLRHQGVVEESLREALNSPYHSKILASLDEEDRLLSLGGLFLANKENQAFLQGIVSNLSVKLISLLEEKETSENRARIVRILGKAKIEAAVESLTKILQNNKTTLSPMQMEAAKALGRINTAATQKTLQALATHPKEFLRLAAANAFGASNDPSNERSLLPLLEDPDILVRSGALWALEQIGSTELSTPILERLSKQPEIQTRLNVARALAKNNASKATELLKVLAEDQDVMVALAAKEALASRRKE
jgi:HEAT repeat protein